MKINVKPEYKDIVKMFNELTGSKGLWQVFNDCIELYALTIQNRFTFGKQYDENEKTYKAIITQYSKQEQEVIVKIFAEIVVMLGKNPFRDLLGDLYMQLNMGSSELGQFFTPYHLSLAMAKMTANIDEIKKTIETKGYITVQEPACGGGSTIIALCEHLYLNDINYQNKCVIVCQDLSRISALMCYVTLSLIGCSAVIKVGDTLCSPYENYKTEVANGSELWTTPMFHINNCYSKV